MPRRDAHTRPGQRTLATDVLLMRVEALFGHRESPRVCYYKPRLKRLMTRSRMRMNDRRRQPLQPRQLCTIGHPAALPRTVRRHECGEQPGGRRGPLSPGQATGVGGAGAIAAKGPMEEFHGDHQHQSACSGHVARIAVRRFSLGVRYRRRLSPAVEGHADGLCVCDSLRQEHRPFLNITDGAGFIASTVEPRGSGFPGSQLRTGAQRETPAEGKQVGVQPERNEEGPRSSVRFRAVTRPRLTRLS